MIFGSTLTAFRNRVFATLWSGAVISNIGGQIQMVGAAWLMTSMTSSQSMVSMVMSAASLPIVLGSAFAGVLADGFDRRLLMLIAQTFMLVVSVLLVLVTWQGALTPWLLLAFTFLIGCGTALHNPSWHATISHVVDPRDMAGAISLNAMGQNVTRALGPAAGGAIVAQFGAVAAFAVNALTYPALILALLRWKPQPRTSRLPREEFLRALGTGLRYFALSPKLLNPAFRTVIFAFAAIPVQSLLPLVVRDRLGGDAVLFGLLLGCFGLGAIVAALMNVWLRSRFTSETLCRIGFSSSAAALVVIGQSPWVVLTALAVFVSGVWWLALFSLLNVTVQVSTPKWVLGRVLSIYLLGLFAGMTVGAWFWGLWADRAGSTGALVAAAAVMLGGALWGLRLPLHDLAQDDLSPVQLEGAGPPPDLAHESGPVTISIEYLIRDEDLPAFLACMVQRRRLRMRAGGYGWQLDRDVEQRERWIESFHFANWVDYLRHHERRIRQDIEMIETLSTLHRGEGRPRVTRTLRARPGLHSRTAIPLMPQDPH